MLSTHEKQPGAPRKLMSLQRRFAAFIDAVDVGSYCRQTSYIKLSAVFET